MRAIAVTLTLLVGALSATSAAADEGDGSLASFDARGVASVGSFCFLAPQAFYPIKICGGTLESTAIATSDPRGFALAGLAPVPVLASVGLLVPQNEPITGTPVPPDVQAAFKSFDFSSLPTQCQAAYPPVKEGDDENFCGGPTAGDKPLGLKSATLNGHVVSRGSLEERFRTNTEATSRAADIAIPNLQARFHGVHSSSRAGLNADGRPQVSSEAVAADLALLGNLVRFYDLRSHTAVVSDGTKDGTAAVTNFGIGSASVAGVPVVIGPNGVTVAGESVGDPAAVPALTAKVNEALKEAGGVSIRMLPAPPVRHEGTTVTAESGALEIRYQTKTPTEMEVLYRFGYTSARVNGVPTASGADEPLEPPIGDLPAAQTGEPEPATVVNDTTGVIPDAATALGPVDSPTIGASRPDSVGNFPLPPADPSSSPVGTGPVGALTPDAAAAASVTHGRPELVRSPVGMALASQPLEKLYPAYLALMVLLTVLVRSARTRLWRT